MSPTPHPADIDIIHTSPTERKYGSWDQLFAIQTCKTYFKKYILLTINIRRPFNLSVDNIKHRY